MCMVKTNIIEHVCVRHSHIFYFFRFLTLSFEWFTLSHFSPGQLKCYCPCFCFLAFLALHHSGQGWESLPRSLFSDSIVHCIQFDLTGSSASGFFPFLSNFLAQVRKALQK